MLRELIRAGILPATRSSRSWWLDDADVLGLHDTFDVQSGKVRAFRCLDRWLRERCVVVPATPAVTTLLAAPHAGLVWRGAAYLPKSAWQDEASPDGQTLYRHRSGLMLVAPAALAA